VRWSRRASWQGALARAHRCLASGQHVIPERRCYRTEKPCEHDASARQSRLATPVITAVIGCCVHFVLDREIDQHSIAFRRRPAPSRRSGYNARGRGILYRETGNTNGRKVRCWRPHKEISHTTSWLPCLATPVSMYRHLAVSPAQHESRFGRPDGVWAGVPSHALDSRTTRKLSWQPLTSDHRPLTR